MSADFYAAEVTAYRPGEGGGMTTYSWGSDVWGAPPQQAIEEEASVIFRASDSGYRTEYASGDVRVYPAVLERTVDLDRQLVLPPSATGASLSWGTIRLINADGRWDEVSTSFSCDGRPVRLAYGRRSFDRTRRLWLDPASTTLTDLFRGLAQGWRLAETVLEVPLRDASYWLQQPYQRNTYGGTGGLDGDESLKGQTLPRVRGGNSTYPVRHCGAVLVDAVARIYQVNDGPCSIDAVFENGAPFAFAGVVSDLYAGSTPPGSFRVDNARGLFQLGSNAVGTITANVLGSFPVAGLRTDARDLIRYILTEDMQISADLVDLSAFTTLPAGIWSGWSWPSGDTSTGADAVSMFLRGLGAKLVPGRNGKLRPILLRTLPPGIVASGELTPTEIISLTPNVLPTPLDPPAYRWRIGYGRNHTVQGASVSGTLTDAQRRALRQEWQVSTSSSPDALAAYAQPSDPEIVPTALLAQSDADGVSSDMVNLWSRRRRLYDVTVPVEIGMAFDLGDVISLTYPFGDLRRGQIGRVVADQLRGNDGTLTLQVLV